MKDGPPKWLKPALASRDETIRALAAILENPDHPHFIQALKFAADRGYGRPTQPVALEGLAPRVVIVAPPKLTTEEWLRMYGGLGRSGDPPLLTSDSQAVAAP